MLGLVAGCGHAGSQAHSPGVGASTNGIKFVEVDIADRRRFPLPNQMRFAMQNPVAYARGLLSGRPRYTVAFNSGFCPLNEALKTYAYYTGKRIFLAEDLQELKVGPFVLSANTQRGIVKGLEKAILTNGVAFLMTGSNTVMVVPASGMVIGPTIAPSGLRAAAESGDTNAQVHLATWYYEQKPSRPANRVEAVKWAVVAANRQSQDAKLLVHELQLFVPPNEQAEGKAAAATFLESHPEAKPRS